jgi:2,3-bisphosphoglycerate-independent phosphoglycerate mutase
MDGWGVNPKTKGKAEANADATAIAKTPNLDELAKRYPYTTLDASGPSVGLPDGQMGNSEVGHLTIGSGRVIYQELTRINKAIEAGGFKENPAFAALAKETKERHGALHLMGLVSDGGVHSHNEHLYALIDAAGALGLKSVYVHAFLDGRDTPPSSGAGYIKELAERLESSGAGRIATIAGRYYAMDRDRRWDRVEKAYNAITFGAGLKAENPLAAVEQAYARGETDEFVIPTVITDGSNAPLAAISPNDSILFFNFRADRARELTEAFVVDDLDAFKGKKRLKAVELGRFVTMTEYDRNLKLPTLFSPQEIKRFLGEVLSSANIKQFRVTETEKYAHVTFFFNGGVEKPMKGEERLLIPSVKEVDTYDKSPAMRAAEIAAAAVKGITSGAFGFMLMNFANGDMVGHTGILAAAVKGCEAVDTAVGRVVEAARTEGWKVLITADHGNAEQMIDYATGTPHTAHTTNPVPFILVDDELNGKELRDGGGLKDIAPTVLKLLDIEQPKEMDGAALF